MTMMNHQHVTMDIHAQQQQPPTIAMQPQSRTSNGSNDAAFGMSFYAPHDASMENSERTSSIMSDISGLSSNLTSGKQQQQHQQPQFQDQQNSMMHALTEDHLAKVSSEQEQTGPVHYMNRHHMNMNMMAPPPVAARHEDGSLMYAGSGMLDTTSSLPSISNENIDDAEMLSSTCGGAVSSLAMGSVVSEDQNPDDSKTNKKKPSTLSMMKKNFLGGGLRNKQQQQSTPVLQPLPPALTNPAADSTDDTVGGPRRDSSTCVSGKSDVSFPFSVGSMSNFSDDFRALNLNMSDRTESDVANNTNNNDAE